MVAKCANPACNREFRELSKGRLYLLPPVYEFPESMAKKSRLIDYCYWLCPQCAESHTLTVNGTGPVILERTRSQSATPRMRFGCQL